MAAPTITAPQIRAFRLRAHGVTGRPGHAATALGGWAVQESPPGAAGAAVLARTADDLPAGWLDDAIAARDVISLYNARTATAILPPGGAAAFGTALLPEGDAELKAVIGRAIPEQSSGYAEPVELAVGAISEALDGRALSRDELHQALREALPEALLPWCDGCKSHHARRGLLVMASLRGRLCISGRAGRQPEFSRTDQWAGWKAPAPQSAREQLARRFVHLFGPVTPPRLAEWAGVAPAHGKAIWATIAGELAEVQVGGGAKGWVLADDLDALQSAEPAAEGARLIGPGDPLLQAKDREVLVPDEAARKKIWTAIPTTGVLLAEGEWAGTWKAKKAGKKLAVTVTAAGGAKARIGRVSAEIEAEAARLATLRGSAEAAVTIEGV